MDSTLSTGTERPNLPVVGSVTSVEFTTRALRCSPAPSILISPSGPRTTPGTRGRVSVTVAGREGRDFTSWGFKVVAVEEVCSPSTLALACTSTFSTLSILGIIVNSISAVVAVESHDTDCAGFEPLAQSVSCDSTATTAEIEFTMIPKIERVEKVEVQASASVEGEQTSSTATTLNPQDVKSLPSRPATVTDTLPLVPGVVRGPDGEIKIEGAGEHRSALVVNSTDVTDPTTGRFGLSVPVDSVESIDVYKTPFLAEYGRFTSGVVSVETRRGGEKWHFELNDPLPGVRIYSWHLRGLRDFTPRVTFGGPLLKNRLYFHEGLEYALYKRPVRTLPFPYHISRSESVNSFSQFDYVFSTTHFLTGTYHLAPQHTNYVNLGFFSPQPVTPTFRASSSVYTSADHLALGQNLLTSTVSAQFFDASTGAQGTAAMVLTPAGP